MTKAEKAWLKKTLTGLNKRLTALDKSQLIIQNMIEETQRDVRNLLLALQETQNQQRASSGTLRAIDGGKITPRVRDPRREPPKGNR